MDLTKLLPATARKLQFDPGQSFAGNVVVEQINTLIEQRCALTIRRLTDPAADNDAAAEPHRLNYRADTSSIQGSGIEPTSHRRRV